MVRVWRGRIREVEASNCALDNETAYGLSERHVAIGMA